MAPKGWGRRFDDPIPVPRGRQLVMLQATGEYITKLPTAAHDGSLDPGRDARRADDVCWGRRHEGIEPPRRAGV